MKLILPVLVVSTMPRSDDDDKYVSYNKPFVTSFESYHHRTAPKRRLRLSPNDGRNASHRRNRAITYRMSILLLLLPFSSYIFVTNAAFTTTTTMDVSQKPSSSVSHRNVYTSSPPICHTRPHPYATYHNNPMGIKTKASLFPTTKLLLLLNTEMEPTSSISATEIDRRRNTASTTTGTTIKENVDSNYNNNNQPPPKSSGDKIYSRVKAFGKLLTFQASNPKNSAYFFGRTNNKMQHYYQGVDPSRRIFQMADDLDIESNTNKNNNKKKKSTGTAIHQSPGSTRTTQRKKRQTDEDRYDNNTEETNAVFTTFDSNVQSFVQPAGDEREVWEALASLEKDMSLLDRMIGQKPQLSNLQLLLLGGAVLSTASSPLFLAGQLTEFIAPSMAAFTAAIGIAAEYRGRVAVADSKEVAAASLQCAAEAEGYLASAERAKAITPLCVGIGATAATLSLLVPVLVDSVFVGTTNLQLVTEIYLLCPLIAVLSSAVAGLAVQEVKSYCSTAVGVGNRRFARSGIVSRTWMSATEMIALKSKSSVTKWRSFSISVLPAPILGALCPGALPTKTIVVAALAAAGSAYYLARAEYIVARAADAVALKARSAAVCDTYANQGSRSAAILPFTSALSSLCAAATAAVVELPFVESLTGRFGTTGTMLEIITITIFPALSALFAAAASVSKARCEVDAEAAMQAASTIALPYNDAEDDDPIMRPLQAVRELIRLTIMNSIQEPVRRFFRGLNLRTRWRYVRRAMVRLQGR